MKKDSKTFHEVAERCTRFTPATCGGDCGCSNCTGSDNVSCNSCQHYEPSNVCTLDLYQEIVSNHNL